MAERQSWADEDSHRAWLGSPQSERQARYVLIAGAGQEAQSVDSLTELSSNLEAPVTVLDLKSLGVKLSRHLSERPSSVTIIRAGKSA